MIKEGVEPPPGASPSVHHEFDEGVGEDGRLQYFGPKDVDHRLEGAEGGAGGGCGDRLGAVATI